MDPLFLFTYSSGIFLDPIFCKDQLINGDIVSRISFFLYSDVNTISCS